MGGSAQHQAYQRFEMIHFIKDFLKQTHSQKATIALMKRSSSSSHPHHDSDYLYADATQVDGEDHFHFSSDIVCYQPAPHALDALDQLEWHTDTAHTVASIKAQLAAQHEVRPEQIVLAEHPQKLLLSFMLCMSQTMTSDRQPSISLPEFFAPELLAIVRALKWQILKPSQNQPANLVWHAQPCPISGGLSVEWNPALPIDSNSQLILDFTDAPWQLEGLPSVPPQHAWQLWNPSRAMGVPYAPAAYLIAPAGQESFVSQLTQLLPSHSLGQAGLAIMQAWMSSATPPWLFHTRAQLRAWKHRQLALCQALGWIALPSCTPQLLMTWNGAHLERDQSELLSELARHGVVLTPCPIDSHRAYAQVQVLPPHAQDALAEAWLQSRLALATRVPSTESKIPDAAPPDISPSVVTRSPDELQEPSPSVITAPSNPAIEIPSLTLPSDLLSSSEAPSQPQKSRRAKPKATRASKPKSSTPNPDPTEVDATPIPTKKSPSRQRSKAAPKPSVEQDHVAESLAPATDAISSITVVPVKPKAKSSARKAAAKTTKKKAATA